MQIIRRANDEDPADLTIELDQQPLRQALASLPGWALAVTEHDSDFWQRQRISVWSRISAADSRSARRAPILAFALAGALMAVSGWLVERPLVVPPREAYVDPDHELLIEVERMVQIDGPLALEPAALLAQEMVQDLPARNYPIRKKEPSNEN
jgi:hypothetical protein